MSAFICLIYGMVVHKYQREHTQILSRSSVEFPENNCKCTQGLRSEQVCIVDCHNIKQN